MDRTAAFYSAPSYQYRGAGGFPVFSGSRRQRGGSILGSIAKVAMPILGNIGKAALGQAVGLAKDVAGDLAQGRNIGQSLKQHGLKRLKNTAMSSLSSITGRPPTVTGPRRRVRRQAPGQAPRQAPLGKRRATSLRKQPPRKKSRQALF